MADDPESASSAGAEPRFSPAHGSDGLADPGSSTTREGFWPSLDTAARLRPDALFDLDERVAIVTGAGGGLGRWIATGLGAARARLVLTDQVGMPLEGLADGLRAAGVTVTTITVDLMSPDAPTAIVDAAVTRFGRVDVLVNNAAVNRRVPILDVEAPMLDWIWAINFRQPYLLAQAAARVMVGRGSGSIIHVSSINQSVGIEDLSLYAPTKAAISQLARVMAVEWSHLGIRTNAIAPGFFDTPMNTGHWSHPTRAPWILDRIPLCRPGDPAELVGVCLLLASDAGSYITGQTLVVDGGFTIGSRWNVEPGSGLREFRTRTGLGPPEATP